MADDKRPPMSSDGPALDREPRPAPAPAAPAPDGPLNETVPGGRYIVNGQTVDAEGRPLSSAGR